MRDEVGRGEQPQRPDSDLEGDTLTIWGGQKGSPAFYKARSATTAPLWLGSGYTPVAADIRRLRGGLLQALPEMPVKQSLVLGSVA